MSGILRNFNLEETRNAKNVNLVDFKPFWGVAKFNCDILPTKNSKGLNMQIERLLKPEIIRWATKND